MTTITATNERKLCTLSRKYERKRFKDKMSGAWDI